MKFGYARVSTEEQSVEMQTDALERAGCDRVYHDSASGTKWDRPGFADLMDHLRPGDSVVVWKLDRLGRTTKELIELMGHFEEMGVEFVSLSDGIDTTTATGRFFFRVMASFAELERDLISERTRAGLAAARARGRKGGRPRADGEAVDRALRMYESRRFSVKEICAACRISQSTLYKYLKESKPGQGEG